MSTSQQHTQSSESSGPLGSIGGSISKLFSGKALMGLILGAVVGLLFGGDPMITGLLAVAGAASTSGVLGDLFSGVKEFLVGLTGKGNSSSQAGQQQQTELAQGPQQDQVVAPGYTPGFGQSPTRGRAG